MTKAIELAELTRTIIDSANATAITINSSEQVTFAEDIILADSKKALFGAGSDLQIYHDGNHSFISDQGTGHLKLLAGDFRLNNAADNAQMIAAVTGGEVALYHNNSLKLSTTATGASVTNAGGPNNDDTANAFHISGTEHLRAVIDTASTSGHRASLVLESNSQETVLSTTGAASELVVPVGGFTLDVAGDITLDADDVGHVRFKDGGTQYASIFKSGSGAVIDTPSGGDITLDSANDIILDAAGNDIIFKDAGTTFGQITNDSTNIIIYNAGSQMLKGLSSGSNAQFMGKVGVGSVLHSWTAFDGVAQIGRIGAIANYDGGAGNANQQTLVASNTYYGSGGYTAIEGAANAAYMNIASGQILFAAAPAVSAGSAQTFTRTVTIDTSGNVGIGAISPSFTAVSGSTSQKGLHIQNSGNDTSAHLKLTGHNNTGTPGQATDFEIIHRGDALQTIFRHGGADALTLDSSSNLLIGTSVLTDITSSGTGNEGAFIKADGSSGFATSNQTLMTLNRKTSNGDIFEFRKDGTLIGSIGIEGGDSLYIQSDGASGGGLRFHNNGGIAPMRNGSLVDDVVDLGTSTKRFQDLHLSGAANVMQLKFPSVSYDDRAIGLDGTGFYLYNTDDSRYDVIVNDSGTVLVGKTSANAAVAGVELVPEGVIHVTRSSGNTYHMHDTAAYKFYVNANGGIYNYAGNNVNLSDEREKKNIETLGSQWDVLKKWSLKKFHYNADDNNDPKKYGVIAQDVESHNPEVVTEFQSNDDETRKAVREQSMMWMAIKALQEAQIRIETLETEVEALKAN